MLGGAAFLGLGSKNQYSTFSHRVCVCVCSVVSYSFQSHGPQPARLLCPWGFSRQEYWSGLPFPSSGDLPDPGTKPGSPASAGRFFTVGATREAHRFLTRALVLRMLLYEHRAVSEPFPGGLVGSTCVANFLDLWFDVCL